MLLDYPDTSFSDKFGLSCWQWARVIGIIVHLFLFCSNIVQYIWNLADNED